MEGNLKGDYLRLMPGLCLRGQNELVCNFKMSAGDMVSIWGQVMEYTYSIIKITFSFKFHRRPIQ